MSNQKNDWIAAREYFGLDESFQYDEAKIDEYVAGFRAAMKRTNLDTAITGAYIGLGLFYDAPADLLKIWDHGQVELVMEACRYAEYINELAAAGYEATEDYPGVFEYEVTEYFGKWFRESLLERRGQPPTPQMCRVYLLNEVQNFFTQGCDDIRETVGEALMRVPFEHLGVEERAIPK